MGERLDVDPQLDIIVELDEMIRRLQTIRDYHARHLVARSVPTLSTGLPCVADMVWDGTDDVDGAVATHAMEPLDHASLLDEPPSRPLP
jgi:hypothetical protein